MKLKLSTIYFSEQALIELASNKKIKTFDAMQLRLEIIKLKPIIEEIINFRNELIKKYGELDKKTGLPVIAEDSPNMKLFRDEFYENFLKNEQEVDLKKVTISFSQKDELEISANQMNLLEYFVEFKVKE